MLILIVHFAGRTDSVPGMSGQLGDPMQCDHREGGRYHHHQHAKGAEHIFIGGWGIDGGISSTCVQGR